MTCVECLIGKSIWQETEHLYGGIKSSCVTNCIYKFEIYHDVIILYSTSTFLTGGHIIWKNRPYGYGQTASTTNLLKDTL